MFDFGGLTVAHLGDLAQVPTQTQIETLGAVDIVLVPVGGGTGLNATQAAEIVSLIEPSIIVPMHYQTDPYPSSSSRSPSSSSRWGSKHRRPKRS